MNLTELIAQRKRETEQAKSRLLKTFGFVPDDKLHWSPAPTARSPLWIAAHCGMSNAAFATVLRGEVLPMPEDRREASRRIREGGKDTRTREEAIELIEQNTAKVLDALDRVTEQMVTSSPPSPFGPIPFTFWMELPAGHMNGHASQIDYLQTIWGDIENHI